MSSHMQIVYDFTESKALTNHLVIQHYCPITIQSHVTCTDFNNMSIKFAADGPIYLGIKIV